jgi:hypothetical protein
MMSDPVVVTPGVLKPGMVLKNYAQPTEEDVQNAKFIVSAHSVDAVACAFFMVAPPTGAVYEKIIADWPEYREAIRDK